MAANYRCKIVEKADSNADSWAKHKRKKEEEKVGEVDLLTLRPQLRRGLGQKCLILKDFNL